MQRGSTGLAIFLAFLCLRVSFLVSGLDLGTKHAQQEGRLPSHSTVAAWLEPSHENDYFSFTNVKLTESSLLFFKDSVTSPSDHQPPAEILLNQHEAVVPMVVRQVTWSDDVHCSNLYKEPAILIAGTPWDSNLYEMLANNVMPVWATAYEEGHLDADRYLQSSEPPESASISFLLIQARSEGYTSPWSYIFNYMTPEQKLLSEVEGACFADLKIISNSILRFLVAKEFADPAAEAIFTSKRKKYLQAFQRWMLLVERLHQASQGSARFDKPADSAAYSRPRVIFSSRPTKGGVQSRGILNEKDVVDFIEEQYDVNVTLVDFNGPLERAMNLVQSSHLFLGMHGAGLTHALWLRPGSHFLQLAPYGFSPDGIKLIRGGYYEEIAIDTGSTASHWVNPHAHKAMFHKEHFREGDGEFFSHPNETTPVPAAWNPPNYWIYQSTEIDIESFSLALHHAMSMINVPRRHL